MRTVSGLLWSRPVPRPSFIPQTRPRGSKGAGLRYERKFAAYLGSCAVHGQWFEYEDANGIGYCQPDILISRLPRYIIIIENKYTLVPEAFDQLQSLYAPVVTASFGQARTGLVAVFRNFPSHPTPLLWSDLDSAALFSLETGQVALLHWCGQPVLARTNPRLKTVLAKIAHTQNKSAA